MSWGRRCRWRGLFVLGTTDWPAGVRSMWSAQEKNMRFRAETGVSPDVARLRRNAEVKGLHHPEGVVHHDGDVEGRAPVAVALGLHSGMRVPRKPMRWTELSSAAELRRESVWCPATGRRRASMRDWVSSTRTIGRGSRAGEREEVLSRRSGRGT